MIIIISLLHNVFFLPFLGWRDSILLIFQDMILERRKEFQHGVIEYCTETTVELQLKNAV